MENEKLHEEIVIEFKGGGFGRYPGSSGGKLIIPLGGDLSPIPDHIKELYSIAKNVRMNVTKFSGSNTFVESSAPYKMVTCFFDLAPKNNEDWQVMQLRWVKERNEWIATAYKEELWGFDDCEEFYEGPFAIDEYCADRLRQLYSIPANQLNTQDISITSPFDLKYAATLNSIIKIPPELMTIFTGSNVVDCLKRKYLSYLNESPFAFSKDNEHVWQVLEALEAVLNNNHGLFSKDKEGEELNKDIFGKFVSLTNDLIENEEFAKQMWMVFFLHDIAKYSVQNHDHAQISGNLVRDLFESKRKHFVLNKPEQERIAWVIGNHDVVGNIVSSAERAPRCLIEGLEKLSDEEMKIRLKMLIVLSFCDLRGTVYGKFVNDYNTESRFWAADFSWLKQKEKDLFNWRKERLVRAFTLKETEEKQKDFDETFGGFTKETQRIVKKQIGRNIRVFTNFLYIALWLSGEELAKLFAVISLLAEMVTGGNPNTNYQVDFTKGAERDKPGPIVNGFKGLLKKIKLSDLTLAKITENYNGQTIYGIPISVNQNSLTIDSKKIGDDWLRNEGQRSLKA